MTSSTKRLNSSTSPDVVIRVENLYKEYRLGTISHGTLYKDLQSWWARMRGKEDPNSIISVVQHSTLNSKPSTLNISDNPHMLALDNVSFEVKRGQVLGIIGHNGAGKSTLLKILSEVTAPTRGAVKIKGRVASLLEIGTGFHPELTGRENIFLNGAILGMTKKEIGNKFDEIVDFAEIEKFIDTPVKRYSSGMYVRLAFAVAAHLEPEILIVDEVLAVGDVLFQKKCLGKMGEVASGGRTVLFVSHNMASIKNLCDRAIMLRAGEMLFDGGVNEAVDCYLNNDQIHRSHEKSIPSTYPRIGSGLARLCKVEMFNQRGENVSEFYFGQTFRVVLTIGVKQRIRDEVMAFVYITDTEGTRFAVTYNVENGHSGWQLVDGVYQVILDFNAILLPHRTYSFDIGLFNRPGTEVYDFVEQILQFSVSPASEDGTDNYPGLHSHAFIRARVSWTVPTRIEKGKPSYV
jgi:lipopolysaccharide transport system ATP-binding protein